MSKQSGLGDKLFLQGLDLSGDVGSIQTIGAKRASLDVTGIDQSAYHRVLGLADGEISFASWFNDAGGSNRAGAAASTFYALSALPTTDLYALYCRGASLGGVCAHLIAQQMNHDGNRGADGGFPLSVQLLARAGSPLEFGTQISTGQVTKASTGASTLGEVTAQTTYGGVGFLQYFSRSSGTPTFLIESSSDTTNGVDGTWGTLLTFAGTGGATPFGERKTVTGTIPKGLRWKVTGTFTNAVFAIGFRRGTAQDDVSLA